MLESSFLTKVAGLQALLKRDLTQVFSCEHCEILRKPILKNIWERLLLKVRKQCMSGKTSVA